MLAARAERDAARLQLQQAEATIQALQAKERR
jgi:hypothetical protein